MFGRAAPRHRALAAGIVRRGGDRQLLGAPLNGVFEIGSVTKALTGTLLAEAALRGEVALDDPLSRHLARGRAPVDWSGPEPTLEELATHRSGLPNTPKGMLRPELALLLGLRGGDPWARVDDAAYQRLLAATKVRRRGRVRYSSVGFGLLGEALATAAGASYEELLRARLCEPLGLRDTWVEPPPHLRGRLQQGHSRRGRPRPPIHDAMAAAGSVRSTVADLLVLLEAALDPSPAAPGPALDVATAPRVQWGRRLQVGLGWLVADEKDGSRLVWHNGGTYGFRSVAGFDRTHGIGVAVLANSFRSVDRLALRLLQAAR